MFSKKFIFFIVFAFFFNFCSSFKSSNKSLTNSNDKRLLNLNDKRLNSNDKKLLSLNDKNSLNPKPSIKNKNLIIIKKIPKIKNEIHKQKNELKKLLKRIEKSDRMLRSFENDHLSQHKSQYKKNQHKNQHKKLNDPYFKLKNQHDHNLQFENPHNLQLKNQQNNLQLKNQDDNLQNKHELRDNQFKKQHDLHVSQLKNQQDHYNNQHKNKHKNKLALKNTQRVINHSPTRFEQKVPIQISKLKNHLEQLRALKNFKKEEKELKKKFSPSQNIWNIEANTSLPLENFEEKKNLTTFLNENDRNFTANLDSNKPNNYDSQVFGLNSKNVFIVPDLVDKIVPLKNLDEHLSEKGFIPSSPLNPIRQNEKNYQKLKVSPSEPQIKKYTLQSYPINNQLSNNEFHDKNYYGPNYSSVNLENQYKNEEKNYYHSKENDNFESEKIYKKPYNPSNYVYSNLPMKSHLVQPVQILVQLPKSTASHMIPEKNPHYHYVFINNNQLSKDELPYKEIKNDYYEKFYKKKAENYIPKNIYPNNRYVKPYTVYYQNPNKNLDIDYIETKIEDESQYKKNDVKKNLLVVYSPEEKISKIEDEIKYVNHHFLENEEKTEDYKNYHDYVNLSSEELNGNIPETSNEDLNKLFSDNSFYNKDETVTDNYLNSATQEEIINQPISYLKQTDKKFNKVVVKNENKLTNFSEGQEFMFKYNEPIYQSIIKNNYQNNKKIKNIEEDNLNYESIYHPEKFSYKTDTYKPNTMHEDTINENRFKPINLQKNSSLNDNKLSFKKIEIKNFNKKPVDTNFENEQVDREQVYLFRNGVSHHSLENVYFPSDLENESSITKKKTLKKEDKDKLEKNLSKEILREFNSETEFLNQNHKDTSSIFKYNAYDSYLLDNYGKAGLFPFKT